MSYHGLGSDIRLHDGVVEEGRKSMVMSQLLTRSCCSCRHSASESPVPMPLDWSCPPTVVRNWNQIVYSEGQLYLLKCAWIIYGLLP